MTNGDRDESEMLSTRDSVRMELGERYEEILAPLRLSVLRYAAIMGLPLLQTPMMFAEWRLRDGLEVDEGHYKALIAAAVEEHEARESAEVRT